MKGMTYTTRDSFTSDPHRSELNVASPGTFVPAARPVSACPVNVLKMAMTAAGAAPVTDSATPYSSLHPATLKASVFCCAACNHDGGESLSITSHCLLTCQ